MSHEMTFPIRTDDGKGRAVRPILGRKGTRAKRRAQEGKERKNHEEGNEMRKKGRERKE